MILSLLPSFSPYANYGFEQDSTDKLSEVLDDLESARKDLAASNSANINLVKAQEHTIQRTKLVDQLKADLEASKSEVANLVKVQEATTQRLKLVDQLKAEKDDLSDDLAKATSECGALATELDEKEKTLAETRKAAGKHYLSIRNIDEETSDGFIAAAAKSGAIQAALKTQMSDLMARIADLEGAKEELNVKDQELSALRQQIEDMEAEILRLNTFLSTETHGSSDSGDGNDDEAGE